MDSGYKKRYFELKGKNAEAAVNSLAYRSFLKEWCFPNPLKHDGKEICDLLVCFDATLIICQVKDITFTGKEERYIKKAIEHPKRQVFGAERYLSNLAEPITLQNQNGFELSFRWKDYANVYRLVISVGNGDVPYAYLQEEDDRLVHVFDRSIEVVMNELDTLPDFCKYLKDKEELYWNEKAPRIIAYREIDILGHYIYNNKAFDEIQKYDEVVFEEGLWEKVTAHKQYLAKQKQDTISYFWDHLIEVSRECPGEEYREIARELTRANRFKRRLLSVAFMSALEKGYNANPNIGFKRCIHHTEETYVFVFEPETVSREQRANLLSNACFVARHVYQESEKVIGIATVLQPGGPHAYEFVYLNFPVWSEENRQLAISIQAEYGIFTKSEQISIHMDEYPDIIDTSPTESYKPDKPTGTVGRNQPCPCGSGKKFKKCCGKF